MSNNIGIILTPSWIYIKLYTCILNSWVPLKKKNIHFLLSINNKRRMPVNNCTTVHLKNMPNTRNIFFVFSLPVQRLTKMPIPLCRPSEAWPTNRKFVSRPNFVTWDLRNHNMTPVLKQLLNSLIAPESYSLFLYYKSARERVFVCVKKQSPSAWFCLHHATNMFSCHNVLHASNKRITVHELVL